MKLNFFLNAMLLFIPLSIYAEPLISLHIKISEKEGVSIESKDLIDVPLKKAATIKQKIDDGWIIQVFSKDDNVIKTIELYDPFLIATEYFDEEKKQLVSTAIKREIGDIYLTLKESDNAAKIKIVNNVYKDEKIISQTHVYYLSLGE